MLLEIITTIVLIEAVTNILSKSDIFEPVRAFFFKHCKFIHNLLDCPYCTSVWVGVGSFFLLYLYTDDKLPIFVTLLCMGVVFHRLSNILHHIIDRIDSNHVGLDKENDI